MQLANSIKAMRLVEVQNKESGFKSDYTEEALFYDYYVAMTEKRFRADCKSNWGNWRSCLKHLEKYDYNLKKLTFADITTKWVQGFKEYLENDVCAWGSDYRKRVKDPPLSQNSKASYYRKLKACLNQAYEERIIAHYPIRGVESIKQEEGKRMYLTIDEVKRLIQTECEYPNIKRAFLFSSFTNVSLIVILLYISCLRKEKSK